MMAEALEHCSFGDCTSEAVVYCSVCNVLLCNTHQSIHGELYKKAIKPHTLIPAASAQRLEYSAWNSPFCGLHEKSQIILACTRCYQPMCSKCMDDDSAITKECGRSMHDVHINRSVELVARQIEDALDNLLNDLRVKDTANSDNVTMRRALYDEQMNQSRDDLDKLKAKIQELKQILDEFERATRQTILDLMKERKELQVEFENHYENHQNACYEMREKVSDFKKLNKEAIIKNQRQMKDDIQVQIQYKLEDAPQLPGQLFLEVLDKPLEIPIRLRESPPHTNTPTTLSNPTTPFIPAIPAIPVLPIPTHLRHRRSKTSPNVTFCVYFTKEGKLLHSGVDYGIFGLSFTPKIPTDDSRYNYSICEHNYKLYILQYNDERSQYYVHTINLSDESVSENIIKFQGSGRYSQQLVVNDDFIIISNATAECVRIYSSKNSAHLFDIKHECIDSDPRGVGLLGDTLVVGDQIKNQVSSMTINETPEVRWTCTGIIEPRALRVVLDPQIILVASHSAKLIYILSYQGEKLSALTVPECSDNIFDIAVYGDRIAIADRTKQVKLYEMKVEE